MKYKDREPCTHRWCLNHVTHPCEVCGRIMGIAPVVDDKIDREIDRYFSTIESKVKTRKVYENSKL